MRLKILIALLLITVFSTVAFTGLFSGQQFRTSDETSTSVAAGDFNQEQAQHPRHFSAKLEPL